MSTTNISYSGKVDVQFLNQSRLYKNNGTKYLWKILCDTLAGALEAQSWQTDIPGGIHLLNTNSADALRDTQTMDSLRSSNKVLTRVQIPITKNVGNFYASDETVSSYQCQFTCTILVGQLVSPVPENVPQLCLALVTKDDRHVLAAVDVDANILSVIEDGVQVNVSWTIGFENEATAASTYLIDLIE